jgi:hypothetical protein
VQRGQKSPFILFCKIEYLIKHLYISFLPVKLKKLILFGDFQGKVNRPLNFIFETEKAWNIDFVINLTQ